MIRQLFPQNVNQSESAVHTWPQISQAGEPTTSAFITSQSGNTTSYEYRRRLRRFPHFAGRAR